MLHERSKPKETCAIIFILLGITKPLTAGICKRINGINIARDTITKNKNIFFDCDSCNLIFLKTRYERIPNVRTRDTTNPIPTFIENNQILITESTKETIESIITYFSFFDIVYPPNTPSEKRIDIAFTKT